MEKTLIIHDTFLYRWGGERLVLMIAKTLNADIASWFFSTWSYNLEEQGFTGKAIPLMNQFFLQEFNWLPKKLAFVCKNWLRHFGLRYAFYKNTSKLSSEYDTIILSGDCLTALRHFTGKNVLYYCHTIPRYLFDQKESYRKKLPKFILPIYTILTYIFKIEYLKNLSKIDRILTNSSNSQKRLKDFTWRDATILYPPVDTDFFTPTNTGEKKSYFLSFARLSKIKRVDIIAQTFTKLPNETLYITYGINDPEKDSIKKLVKWFTNIHLIQSPSDKELHKLISYAKATIYIPIDEDFWMSPLESMSCWTPVIWSNEWGLRETIIDGETGYLIPKEWRESDIIEAINKINKNSILGENCIKRAHEFSFTQFQSQLKNLVYKK